jgi:phage gp36-like protein
MAYTTQALIEAEIASQDLIALTDDGNTGSINSTVLSNLITNVSTWIDGKIANIYDVPFATAPTLIQSICLSVVCYRLYRRRLTPDEKNNYFGDYKDAMELLNQINKGEMHLDLSQARNFPQGAVVSRVTTYGGSLTSAPTNSL